MLSVASLAVNGYKKPDSHTMWYLPRKGSLAWTKQQERCFYGD